MKWDDVDTIVYGIVFAWVFSEIRKFVEKYFKFSTPEGRAIAQIVPIVNMMSSTYGSLLGGVKTLLEATKGKCNGNVDEALGKINEAENIYESHVASKLKVRESK